VSIGVVKWSEGVSNRCQSLLDHMKFAAYMAVSLITFFRTLLFPFLSLYIWLYVMYASVLFCKLCILLLCLCILIMFMNSYCYVGSVLGILFHCIVLCIVCVQMCTVILPPAVNQLQLTKYVTGECRIASGQSIAFPVLSSVLIDSSFEDSEHLLCDAMSL